MKTETIKLIQGHEPKGACGTILRAFQAKENKLKVCYGCYAKCQFSALVPFSCTKEKTENREPCFICECDSRELYRFREVPPISP